MISILIKSTALVVVGFLAGERVSQFSQASVETSASPDMSKKHFRVSIDEIQKNFVFFDEFSGNYVKTVTLSDGTVRRIELTPMIHHGMQVVEFKDNDGYTFMSLNGTTTNGTLMVHLADEDALHSQMKAEGWPHFNDRASAAR